MSKKIIEVPDGYVLKYEFVKKEKEEQFAKLKRTPVGSRIRFSDGAEGVVISGKWVDEEYVRHDKAVLLTKFASGNLCFGLAAGYFLIDVAYNDFVVLDEEQRIGG